VAQPSSDDRREGSTSGAVEEQQDSSAQGSRTRRRGRSRAVAPRRSSKARQRQARSGRDLTAADVHRFWANVVGEIVTGWELADEWDALNQPIRWRTLKRDNPEGQQLLRDLGVKST
jgi:hypothetical protein